MYRSQVSRRGWKVFRISLLWGRKGGVFKRRVSSLTKFITSIRRLISNTNDGKLISKYYYQEREFSFDKSPIYHVKMRRDSSSLPFRLPCIHPNRVDFDYGASYDDLFYSNNKREAKQLFLTGKDDIVASETDDEGIDMRAEAFIAKFYQQRR